MLSSSIYILNAYVVIIYDTCVLSSCHLFTYKDNKTLGIRYIVAGHYCACNKLHCLRMIVVYMARLNHMHAATPAKPVISATPSERKANQSV